MPNLRFGIRTDRIRIVGPNRMPGMRRHRCGQATFHLRDQNITPRVRIFSVIIMRILFEYELQFLWTLTRSFLVFARSDVTSHSF